MGYRQLHVLLPLPLWVWGFAQCLWTRQHVGVNGQPGEKCVDFVSRRLGYRRFRRAPVIAYFVHGGQCLTLCLFAA